MNDELWKEQAIDFMLMFALFVLVIIFFEKSKEVYELWTIVSKVG